MKTMIIAVHPSLADGSRMNRKLVEAAKQAGGLTVRDLYAEYPDGRIDVAREQELLLAHDRVVFQFPFWWYSAPSLLKKWIDEVMTFGWAHGPGGDKLVGKEWGLAISTGSSAEAYGREGYNRFTVDEFTRPYQIGFQLVGMKQLPSFIIHGAQQMSDGELERMAGEYVRHVSRTTILT
ncbi:NAD(P)H-dependent oxidoreductase [Cohnella lubricantis]|uniref:NAD(P)H-dependent oxidoreductase n=1 Tax=Cohnella lubricantis TaxID=2163172 RepID=A0A841TDY1_9BACL|nr:NAD(P)H-dependent oxidoreductase [Cohnella lubricantis]MBB6678199.1 NAD(P)H-dependent oxidoreductase [Cohnella lubricantis]MBP2119674.1 glutathione-regulated potassium-efflux system ancillary protein KefG [Cohnella lubricantis]